MCVVFASSVVGLHAAMYLILHVVMAWAGCVHAEIIQHVLSLSLSILVPGN